jgi:hypothetical protein
MDTFTKMASDYLDKKYGGKLLKYEEVVASVNEASGSRRLGLDVYLKIYDVYLKIDRYNY